MASNNHPPIDILAEPTRRTSPVSRYPHQDARRQLVAERERTDSARRELTALFARLRDILGALRADLDVSVAVVVEETTSTTTTGAVGEEDEVEILIASSSSLPIDWVDCTHCSQNGLTRHHKAQVHRGHNHQDSHTVINGGHKDTNAAACHHAMPTNHNNTTTNDANQAKTSDTSGLFPLAAILVSLEAEARGEPVPEPKVLPLRATTDYILESLDRNVAMLLTSLAKVVETMGKEVDREMDKKAEEKAQKKAEKAARKQQRAEKRMKKEQKKKKQEFAKLVEEGIVDDEQETVVGASNDVDGSNNKHQHHTSNTTEHNTHSSSHESEDEHEQEADRALARQHKLAQQAHKITVRRLERLERDLAVDERLLEAHLNKLYNELMFGWRVTYANGMSLHAPLDWRLVEEQDGLVEFAPVEM